MAGIARALANNPMSCCAAKPPRRWIRKLPIRSSIYSSILIVASKLTIVLITHEMHVVRKICDRAAVMENGKVVEGDVLSVFTHPQQPITRQFVRQVSQYTEEDEFNPQLASEPWRRSYQAYVYRATHAPACGWRVDPCAMACHSTSCTA